MPRKARAQRFLVEPLAVTRDPAFEAMDHEARGVYLTILLEAWFERDPGVIRYSPEKMSRLGQCSLADWERLSPQIEPAFHVEQREEVSRMSRCDIPRTGPVTWWTLPQMCHAFSSQSDRRDKDRKRKQRERMRKRDIHSGQVSEIH